MPYAEIDTNDKPTMLAVNDTTGLPEPIRVEPITGAILVFGVADDGLTPTALNRSKIDVNDKPTELGFNETTGLPEAIRCSSLGAIKILPV